MRLRPTINVETNAELSTNAPAPLQYQEGDHCRCGAQYQNGVWCTRMNGLGHEHTTRRPLAPERSPAR